METVDKNDDGQSKHIFKPFSFRWKIEQFPHRLNTAKYKILSKDFAVDDELKISVTVREKDEDDEKLFVDAFVFSKERLVNLELSFTLINTQREFNMMKKGKVDPIFVELFVDDLRHLCTEFDVGLGSNLKILGFLSNDDSLTLLVEGNAIVESQCEIYVPLNRTLSIEVSDEFGKLFDEGAFSDFVVKVKNEEGNEREFKVYKGILAARSNFFAAMFSNPELKECSEGVMVVEDIESETMEALLRFLYTGKFHPAEGEGVNELELLIAADKYGILELKNHLEQVLASKLTVNFVCWYLAAAAVHSAPFLAARCREFIRLRAKEVVETEGWADLCLNSPKLAGSLLTFSIGDAMEDSD